MSIVKIVKDNHVWLVKEKEEKKKFETTATGLLKDSEVYTTDSQQVGIIIQPSIQSKAKGYEEGERVLLPPLTKMSPFKIKGEEYYLMSHSEILSVL